MLDDPILIKFKGRGHMSKVQGHRMMTFFCMDAPRDVNILIRQRVAPDVHTTLP